MLNNPERASRGGDVDGTTPIKVSQGEAIPVSKASFDPGYETSGSLPDTKKSDVVQGYISSGRNTGERG